VTDSIDEARLSVIRNVARQVGGVTVAAVAPRRPASGEVEEQEEGA
jgi:hypothetical protein